SSTKHAVEGYSESLDHELRSFGIRVVLIEPAYTRTSFEENLAKPDQLLGIYDSARAGMNVILRKAMETGDAPEVVAKTVLKAATESVPRRRYAGSGHQAGAGSRAASIPAIRKRCRCGSPPKFAPPLRPRGQPPNRGLADRA